MTDSKQDLLNIKWLLESTSKETQEELQTHLSPAQQLACSKEFRFNLPFSPAAAAQYICLESVHPYWVQHALEKSPKDLQAQIAAYLPKVLSDKLKSSQDKTLAKSSLMESFLASYIAEFYENLSLLPAALHDPISPALEPLLVLNQAQIQQCQIFLALFSLTPRLHTIIAQQKRHALKNALGQTICAENAIAFVRYLQKHAFVTRHPCPSLIFPLHLWDGTEPHIQELLQRYGKGAFSRLLQDTPKTFTARLEKNLSPEHTHLIERSDKEISKKILDDLYKALTYVISFMNGPSNTR